MTIASVIFSSEKKSVGGAQVPGVAFWKWCNLFGVDCHVLSNNADFSPDAREYIGNESLRFFEDAESINNNYDSAFFCTFHPSFPFENLDIPFMFMLHAEFDGDLYGGIDRIRKISNLPNCKGVVVIGENYWNLECPEFLWYPCCLPEYLITGNEEPCYDSSGILYAARISSWKNAHLLVRATCNPEFIRASKRVDIYGAANNQDYYNATLWENPLMDIKQKIFNGYDFNETEQRNSQYDFFWDVSGNANYKLELKRLNLAAFEAMKFGCVPIVNSEAVPPIINSFAPDYRLVMSQPEVLNNLRLSRNYLSEFMFDIISGSEFSFEAVWNQVKTIVENLK